MSSLNDAEKPTTKKLSKHDFYFETPLYTKISFQDTEEGVFSGSVDATVNGVDTTYSINSYDMTGYPYHFENYKKVALICQRKKNENIEFFVYVGDKWFIKVGQYYSMADIQNATLEKKYKRQLSSTQLADFKRAVGLAANGIGAGSFVYLRRIFEDLVGQTYKDNVSGIGLDEDSFKVLRMEEKVENLKEYLPSELLQMKSIYKILSKGVHQLSEEECLVYFEPLKLAIQLILDQKIEEDQKKKRNEEVKAKLRDVQRALGKQDKS